MFSCIEWSFLESPIEEADMVVEQPGGGSSNEKPRYFKLWKAGAVGLQTTTQLSRHPNVQFT